MFDDIFRVATWQNLKTTYLVIKSVIKFTLQWILYDIVPFIAQLITFLIDILRLGYTYILPTVISSSIDSCLFIVIMGVITYIKYITLIIIIICIFTLKKRKGLFLFRLIIIITLLYFFSYISIDILRTTPHLDLFKIKDKEYFFTELQNHRVTLVHASNKLKDSKGFNMELVKIHCGYLEDIDLKYKNDKEVVLGAISSDRCSIHMLSILLENHINEKLKDDNDVMLKSVQFWGSFLDYGSDRIKNNKTIVLAAIKRFWRSLKYAGDNMKNNKEVVLEAVKKNGIILKYASDTLKNDKEVVLEAVKTNGHSLKYASLELQHDEEILKNINITEGMATTPDFVMYI